MESIGTISGRYQNYGRRYLNVTCQQRSSFYISNSDSSCKYSGALHLIFKRQNREIFVVTQASDVPFKGTIKLDVRESVADCAPYLSKRSPEGSPNVLFVLYDDTGLAAWSPYGGRINMPTLDRLAANGLIYTQWHTTALSSPTRSTLLTGRNHHLNGMAAITEGANGFPGASGYLPEQCATIGQVLQDNGWSTFWIGKNHNVAE